MTVMICSVAILAEMLADILADIVADILANTGNWSMVTRPTRLWMMRRLPFNQYALMVGRANRTDMSIETLSPTDSGRGFRNTEGEQAYCDTLINFLARHNRAD